MKSKTDSDKQILRIRIYDEENVHRSINNGVRIATIKERSLRGYQQRI
ncbi:hypothetical protein LEP1GSC061_2436 [Leptospira wolffii serovar Khorat str. Khorat-H2]|nr:hypothetical protein LEP1GSC061_2436 [Leptospira wolffii serovar Khorat str. Khorat-H2]